ncbi:hypothetical protein PQX77_017100 [Marasmius sp. AFHP31]|nr:hypothetical protein PQX77_017100 [Marasmius sp. AFHP31]
MSIVQPLSNTLGFLNFSVKVLSITIVTPLRPVIDALRAFERRRSWEGKEITHAGDTFELPLKSSTTRIVGVMLRIDSYAAWERRK